MRESRLISMCQGFDNGPERPFRATGVRGPQRRPRRHAETTTCACRACGHSVFAVIKVLHRVLGMASQNRDSYDADRA
jgi:hypothetical protein